MVASDPASETRGLDVERFLRLIEQTLILSKPRAGCLLAIVMWYESASILLPFASPSFPLTSLSNCHPALICQHQLILISSKWFFRNIWKNKPSSSNDQVLGASILFYGGIMCERFTNSLMGSALLTFRSVQREINHVSCHPCLSPCLCHGVWWGRCSSSLPPVHAPLSVPD